MYDSDHNYFIDKKEMTKIVKALYELLGIEVNRKSDESDPIKKSNSIFELMDTNRDNKIQETEFLEACLSNQNLMNFLIPF